jgi:hypothetical protein
LFKLIRFQNKYIYIYKMDTTQGMTLGTLIAMLTASIGFVVRMNHKRIRSKCCNKPCTTSIDVEDTTPEPSTTVVREVEPPKL